MKYNIVSNLPLPPRSLPTRKGKSKYPFATMRPGQTAVFPFKSAKCRTTLATNVSQAANKARNADKRFAVRHLSDGSGVGVWCLPAQESV
jgi:hypothetical protein